MRIELLGALVLFAAIPNAQKSERGPDGYVTREIEGFTVQIERSLANPKDELGREAILLLGAKLLDVRRAVPKSALVTLREVTIWLDRNDPQFPCAVYHPSVDWLRENKSDPRKARAVHISNSKNFLDWTREQPAMVLHELSHAYHDRMSTNDRAQVDAAHARAVESKSYDKVLRASGAEDRHYALENPSEFFAESSEAYFGTNDFYPFVKAQLARHDPATAMLMDELWSR